MGHSPAKIDDKGRLKVPADFRKIIEDKYGKECFITSTDGERALVYPLPVWFDFQGRLAKVPSTSQAKQKLLERVNYFGQLGSLDALLELLRGAIHGLARRIILRQEPLVKWEIRRWKIVDLSGLQWYKPSTNRGTQRVDGA